MPAPVPNARRPQLVAAWAWCATALAVAAPTSAQRPTAATANTAPATLRRVTDRMVQALDGDFRRVAGELLAAACEADDRAERRVLLQGAVDLAVRHRDLGLAVAQTRSFAVFAGRDPDREALAVLRDYGERADTDLKRADVAMAALQQARQHAGDDDERALLGYVDLAVRIAARTDHAPFHALVRDHLATLRAPRRLAAELATQRKGSRHAAIDIATCLVHGEPRLLEDLPLQTLAPLFGDLDGFDTDAPLTAMSATTLTALAGHARDRFAQDGLRRCARRALIQEYTFASVERRAAITAQLEQLAEALCRRPGVSRLSFTRSDELELLAVTGGNWRIAHGQLIGEATAERCGATVRTALAAGHIIVIRGGIRGADEHGFGCAVGDVDLLLHGHEAPGSELYHDGDRQHGTAPALSPGQRHTILFFSDGATAHVCIDGVHQGSVANALGGTISIHPAQNGEIFVDEILIDGEPGSLADGPSGERK